jgi:ubiquinone/menaquinone biosynthesis C-methylase UbiE
MITSKDILKRELSTSISSDEFIKDLIERWHNHSKSNHLWNEIEKFNDQHGKILDMACGVGTFFFHGLEKGYDVYGIEPGDWQHEYMSLKFKEYEFEGSIENRVIKGVGESLPYDDQTFDYIQTYQTLEHVQDVEKCINELIRVLKDGGKLRIFAPDYDSFFEPHYSLPFLPKMNKKLAAFYVSLLGKPTNRLNGLTWITSKGIIQILQKHPNLQITDLSKLYKDRYIEKTLNSIPSLLQNNFIIRRFASYYVNWKYYRKVYTFKEEKHINIVVIKIKND